MKTIQHKKSLAVITIVISLLSLFGCKKSIEKSSWVPLDTIGDSISSIKEKIIGSWTGDSLLEGRFQYFDDLRFRLTEFNFLPNQKCIRFYRHYPAKIDTLDWGVTYDTIYSVYKISLLSMQQVIQNFYMKTMTENSITTPYMNCFDYKPSEKYNLSICYKRVTSHPIVSYNIDTLKKQLIGKWKVNALKASSPNSAVGYDYRGYSFENNYKGSIGIAYAIVPHDTIQWTIVQDTLLKYPIIVTKCINKVSPCSSNVEFSTYYFLPIESMNNSTIITQYTDCKLRLEKLQ